MTIDANKAFSFLACIILISCLINLQEAGAAETRRHEAHEHGVARLNIAIEGENLFIEFTSPAINIVGFEHHPTTEKERAAVKQALQNLSKGEALFVLSPDAGGKLAKFSAKTDIDESDSGSAPDSEEDEHHSDFRVEYHFLCKNPEKLQQIQVMLFQSFAGIETIESQLVTPKRQTAVELTRKSNKISM
jgi:hypothetical protein